MNFTNSSLSNNEINRYSRQIILGECSLTGQTRIKNSSVLIIGAGGLGCPCALYLTGAGIGHIGLVDYDQVELNNIHRQILHKEDSIGVDKVQSASRALSDINSNVKISTFPIELNSSNASEVISQFDIVVDASDNVATRYLINDACFFNKKPLVSGSALQLEGQLTVYNHAGGPCYRCLFPIPPPPESVTNCGEGGVLGVIPGTIGVLQALQVLNIILARETLAQTLLLFDGSDCSFRRVRLRGKSPDCALCGTNPTVTGLLDYEQFCSAKANDKNPNLKILTDEQRISPEEYETVKHSPHLLIDVRSAEEFNICHIPDSINIPIKTIYNNIDAIAQEKIIPHLITNGQVPVLVICRRGNDSQKAVIKLKDVLQDKVESVKDIAGGLHAWARDVDHNFPIY